MAHETRTYKRTDLAARERYRRVMQVIELHPMLSHLMTQDIQRTVDNLVAEAAKHGSGWANELFAAYREQPNFLHEWDPDDLEGRQDVPEDDEEVE